MQPITSMLLVRHGQSEWNAAGRWQGHADPPLTELGELQARTAARAIGAVDAVIASDLQRAAATAVILAAEVGVGPVLTDERLRERHVGPWTGLTRAEIEHEWPGWIDDGRRPPGFEPDHEVASRVHECLAEVHDRFTGATVLVVTHGGVIRSVERSLHEHEAGIVANLGARWVRWSQSGPAVGERLVLVDPHDVRVTAPQQQ